MTRAYYASILGVAPNAGADEIKASYRRLVKKYHPDVNPDPKARDKFLELKKAYDYLLKVPYESSGATAYTTNMHPAQKREEEFKRRREQRMKRAREMRIQREELEEKEWENFKGSFSMWVLVFVILVFYFCIMGVCISNMAEYPYEDRKQQVENPEALFAFTGFIGLLFTYFIYRFYVFMRK